MVRRKQGATQILKIVCAARLEGTTPPAHVQALLPRQDVVHPKLSALPTGMCADDPDNRDDFPPANTILPIEKRPLKVCDVRPYTPFHTLPTRTTSPELCTTHTPFYPFYT